MPTLRQLSCALLSFAEILRVVVGQVVMAEECGDHLMMHALQELVSHVRTVAKAGMDFDNCVASQVGQRLLEQNHCALQVKRLRSIHVNMKLSAQLWL